MKYLRVTTSENQVFWNALTDDKYWMLISKLHSIPLVGEEKFPHCYCFFFWKVFRLLEVIENRNKETSIQQFC